MNALELQTTGPGATQPFDLQRIAGACAVLYSLLVVLSVTLLLGSEFAKAHGAAQFLPALAREKQLAAGLSILFVIMPLLLAVAGMGLFQMLRHAGSITWLALFGFVGGGLAIVYRGFTYLAMTLELAPAYVSADAAEKSTLAAVGDTLQVFALGADMVGAVLIGGIGTLICALVMLQKRIGPRWLAWLGIAVAFVGGWLTLLTRTSETARHISFIGNVGFFFWMAGAGILTWRSSPRAESRA